MSLSAWLQAQGFSGEVTTAVQQGQLDKAEVERLKQLRASARGATGEALSKAQKRDIQPPKVLVRKGKLVNFMGVLPVGDGKSVKKAGGQNGGAEMVALRKEVAELKALLRQSAAPAANASQLDADMAMGNSAPLPGPALAGKPRTRACHVCGSLEHLKAECPCSLEMRKQERWIEMLNGDECLLSAELRDAQLAEAQAKLEALRAQAAEAKDRAILPEHLVSTRRAELKKQSEALAAARKKLEEHEAVMRDLQEEVEELGKTVAAEAQAFRQAESALEEAQRRFAQSVQSVQAELVPAVSTPGAAPAMVPSALPTQPPPAPALSLLGTEAMNGLLAQLEQLASAASIKAAEEEYVQLLQAAPAAGEEHPTLLKFVLQRLSQQGTAKLNVVRFDISKEVREVVSDGSGAVAAVPVVATRPSRPLVQITDLADGARLPQRQAAKELPQSAVTAGAAKTAEAHRREARAQLHAAQRDAASGSAEDATAATGEAGALDPMGR